MAQKWPKILWTSQKIFKKTSGTWPLVHRTWRATLNGLLFAINKSSFKTLLTNTEHLASFPKTRDVAWRKTKSHFKSSYVFPLDKERIICPERPLDSVSALGWQILDTFSMQMTFSFCSSCPSLRVSPEAAEMSLRFMTFRTPAVMVMESAGRRFYITTE